MWTTQFWKATAERAVRTAAQTFAATIIVGATGVLDADWTTAGSVTALTTLLSVLTSVAAGAASGTDGPSFGQETTSGVGSRPRG